MSDASVKRPPILTGACLYLGLLSAVMSIRAVTVVSSWNAESRADDVSFALRVLRDAGVGADGAETAYRTFVTVLAVLAAAGAVFAVFTARGDRASRVGMTATIGLVGLATFAGALGTSFFLSMLGALAVVFTIRLWTGEIRTYFRTLAGHPPPAPTPAPAVTPAPAPAVTVPAAPVQQQPAYPYPPGFGPAPRREPLPRPVSIAVWTTMIGSIVAAGLSALMLMAILLTGIDYDAVVEQGGLGAEMVGSESEFDRGMTLITTLSSIAVVLGLAGIAAATLALVRRRSGGTPLFVMAVVTFIVSWVGFPLGLPWGVLAVVAFLQLRKPEAKAWFGPS
ncbi:hypothetical protein AERO_01120 [Aeromicrobium fastidiosum]|uniref:hypothetical protein n=1 Tax=Aeromicrobium fastidiosum TaxID=52699 RepID=UPI0020237758|nr:hypothetical protein [Aeromicrobium fastidiosum]MCL8249969.1 hypothetical protein [Aeromicrobium fastidiosum]